MSKFDTIDNALDIETKEVEAISTPEGGCATRKDQLTKAESTVDYEYTRGNLYSLIEKGQEAINGILEVAQDGQSARGYEVVGQLIKSVGDTTDKLIDLQTKMKDLGKEDKKGPTTVNNALFVGSTSDLSKLIKEGVLNNKGDSED
jgi:hypothetical protein